MFYAAVLTERNQATGHVRKQIPATEPGIFGLTASGVLR